MAWSDSSLLGQVIVLKILFVCYSKFMNPFLKSILEVVATTNLLDQIRHQSSTTVEISEKNGFNLENLQALIYVLISLKFIEISNEKLILTEKGKSFSINSLSDSLTFKRFLAALYNGKASLSYENASVSDLWRMGKVSADLAQKFSQPQHLMMKSLISDYQNFAIFEGINELVDVGGGFGAWPLHIKTYFPSVEVSIFDLPEVCKLGEKDIRFVPGNFFQDELPSSQSYLLSNILHDWPIAECQKILENIHRNLKPGGTIFIHEALLNEDRIFPEFTCILNFVMKANHQSQQFTMNDLSELLMGAGFSPPELLFEHKCFHLLKTTKK